MAFLTLEYKILPSCFVIAWEIFIVHLHYFSACSRSVTIYISLTKNITAPGSDSRPRLWFHNVFSFRCDSRNVVLIRSPPSCEVFGIYSVSIG